MRWIYPIVKQQQRSFSTNVVEGLNILLVGAPGVGKGTYAKHISPFLKIPHISSGDLIRDYLRNNSSQDGIADRVKSGGLVDDDMITELLKQRLSEDDCKRGVLLDGFPRSVPQIARLEEFRKITGVLNLSIREDLLVRKAVARRTCPSCGRGYNVADIHEDGYRMPAILPAVEGVCDNCGTTLTQRPDDNEATVKDRITLYKQVTEPITDIYRKKGLVVDFELTSGVEDMLPILMNDVMDKILDINGIDRKDL